MLRLFSKIKSQFCKTLLGKLFLLSFLLFSYSSCSDQGCIAADDFGEYERQELVVPANGIGEDCEYNPSLSLTDALQPSGLKACFISGSISIVDETGSTYSGNAGCNSLVGPPSVTMMCIEQCRQNCINQNNSNSGAAEPDWVATSAKEANKNSGINITPNSKVTIRVVGSVSLAGDKSISSFVKSSAYDLQSQQSSFDGKEVFMDVYAGSVLNFKFSGKWTDGADTSGNSINETVGGDTSNINPTAAYNAGNRIAAYIIPHPVGYKFLTSVNNESDGNLGTPLFSNPSLWKCSYNGLVNNTESSCQSNDYPTGEPATNQAVYGITSSKKADNLGTIGGMIRYVNDNLIPFSDNPSSNRQIAVGNLSSGEAFVKNTDTYANRIEFTNTSVETVCNITLVATIKDKDGLVVTPTPLSISVNTLSWTNKYINLEPGDEIKFASNNSNTSDGENCGISAVKYRLDKLHDIKINKSGFVSFRILGGEIGSSGSCTLKGRIINPNGSRINQNGLAADFYEYEPFGITSVDPTASLNIDTTAFSTSPVFVRKGQVIRFDPESWNGTWIASASAGARKCGVGAAMHIKERPAFLCRGVAQSPVPNPNCKISSDSSGNPVCDDYSADCFDDQVFPDPQPINTDSYCPREECQDLANASQSGDSQVYDAALEAFNAAGCQKLLPFNINYGTCYSCKQKRIFAAQQSTTNQLNLIQCYDLENYNGKISNINPTTGFTDAQLSDENISKGAELLKKFNGQYGNFSNLIKTPNTDAGNVVYETRLPLLINTNGRMKFLVLDGDDFNQNMISSYPNNGGSGSSYTGANGYKIELSGKRDFSNGQWLEIKLCKEDSASTYKCSSSNVTQITTQPNVVTIADPVSDGQDPLITSFYEIDPYGTLTRFANPNATGVDPNSNVNFRTNPGDNYYLHSSSATPSLLRLSFKIKDPEVANCKITSPELNQDCSSGGCDGVVINNRFFDSESVSINKICLAGENPAADGCKKEYFCGNKYFNNTGKYNVLVKVENKNSNISDIVNQVVAPVIEVMDGSPDGTKIGQAERIYKLIVADSSFQAIVKILVTLMITFYGVGYLMGVSEFSQAEIVSRIIKIGVIYLFISPTGWDWFNQLFVGFFKDGVNYITFLMASAFDRSPALQQAIDTNSFYDKSILFSGIDKVFGMFFAPAVQKKISALLFASIFGWAYCYIIYLSFFLYVSAVANSVLLYLTAQVFISILFVLSPLFFLTLLFNQTKDMFDKWLSELIGFSLQQIFLLVTLAFFNMMMYEVIKMSLGYSICWDDVWVINIYITKIKLLSFWTISSMPPRLNMQAPVGNIGNPEGIPSLFSILTIWIIASLMETFIGFMTDLAASIGGGVKASAMGSGIKDAAKKVNEAGAKMYQDKIGEHVDSAMESADRALFDSGKKAEADRGKAKDQDKKDNKNRGSLSEAGDAAVAKARASSEYMALSADKKEAHLKDAANKGMKAKAAELGLNDKDTNRLINTAPKISNATTASELMKEAWQKRGGALSDKKYDTAVSRSEFQNAKNNADDDGKKALDKSVESGSTKISGGHKAAARDNFSDASKQNVLMASVSNIKGAAHEALGAMGDAKDALRSAKKGVQNVLPSALGGRESSYDKATKELQDIGRIDTMMKGTGWARGKEDKKEIRAAASKHKDDSSIKTEKLSKEAAAAIGVDRDKNYKDNLGKEHMEAQSHMMESGKNSEFHESQSQNTSLTDTDRKEHDIASKQFARDAERFQNKSEAINDILTAEPEPIKEQVAKPNPLFGIPPKDDK